MDTWDTEYGYMGYRIDTRDTDTDWIPLDTMGYRMDIMGYRCTSCFCKKGI